MSRFMVDAADHDNLEQAKSELFALLDKPTMAAIPVLVLGNKRDLPAALDEKQLIDKMYVICARFISHFYWSSLVDLIAKRLFRQGIFLTLVLSNINVI